MGLDDREFIGYMDILEEFFFNSFLECPFSLSENQFCMMVGVTFIVKKKMRLYIE